MSRFTLATGTAEIFSSLIVQGLGFSCLFVPLSTVALATIPRHLLTDATGLNSLFRQMGGSVGLAVFATLLARWNTSTRGALLANVTLLRPDVQARVSSMQTAFIARGFDPVSAGRAALRALDGMVRQQAAVISFERLFLLAGGLFLAVLPLLFFLKAPPTARTRHAMSSAPALGHVEV